MENIYAKIALVIRIVTARQAKPELSRVIVWG